MYRIFMNPTLLLIIEIVAINNLDKIIGWFDFSIHIQLEHYRPLKLGMYELRFLLDLQEI